MKLLITFDSETGEPIEFMWNEGRRPPPLINPKTKKKEEPMDEHQFNEMINLLNQILQILQEMQNKLNYIYTKEVGRS